MFVIYQSARSAEAPSGRAWWDATTSPLATVTPFRAVAPVPRRNLVTTSTSTSTPAPVSTSVSTPAPVSAPSPTAVPADGPEPGPDADDDPDPDPAPRVFVARPAGSRAARQKAKARSATMLLPIRPRRPRRRSRRWWLLPLATLLVLVAACMAWVSAPSWWLAAGRGSAGTAVILSDRAACRATFTAATGDESTVDLYGVPADGCTPGVAVPARLSYDRIAYAADTVVARSVAGGIVLLACAGAIALLLRTVNKDALYHAHG